MKTSGLLKKNDKMNKAHCILRLCFLMALFPCAAAWAQDTSGTIAFPSSGTVSGASSGTATIASSDTSVIVSSGTSVIASSETVVMASSATLEIASPSPTSDSLAGGAVIAINASRSTDALSFVPPLCLEDAIELTTRAIALLQDPEEDTMATREALARRMMALTREYCEFLDNRHSVLDSYRWIRIATHDVPGRGILEADAKIRDPIPNVSAITFEAAKSDVWIWTISYKTSEGDLIRLPVESAIFRNMPWSEVCHVPARHTLREISVRCQTWGAPGELIMYAGVTKKREFARRAVSHIQMSEKALNEDRIAEAIGALQKSHENMERFRKENKSD